MSSEGKSILESRIRRLKTELAAARSDFDRILQEEGSAYWDLNLLLSCLYDDLQSPVQSIIGSSEVLQTAIDPDDRYQLAATVRLAARRLDDALQKIADIGSVSCSRFQPELCYRSVQSLTHESILLIADLCSVRPKYVSLSDVPVPDTIIEVDTLRFARLLASCARLVVDLSGTSQLYMTSALDTHEDAVLAQWVLTPDAPRSFETAHEAPRLPRPQIPFAGRIALDTMYSLEVRSVLNAEVSTPASGIVQISALFPLIRTVHPIGSDRLSHVWTHRPVFVLDEPPASFTPIGASLTRIPNDVDPEEFADQEGPGLFVLHHTPHTRPVQIERNLQCCRRSEAPVLLRASGMTYDQFLRFRNNVDAIVLEPSDEAVLARYVIGLSGLQERRSAPRGADIH